MEEFIKNIKPDTTLFDRFRKRVMEECNVSRQTWYNWANGKQIEAKYKHIINRVATELYGKMVFDEEGGDK